MGFGSSGYQERAGSTLRPDPDPVKWRIVGRRFGGTGAPAFLRGASGSEPDRSNGARVNPDAGPGLKRGAGPESCGDSPDPLGNALRERGVAPAVDYCQIRWVTQVFPVPRIRNLSN